MPTFFDQFIQTADPSGRYVIVCRPHIWTVCDLVERRVLRSFEYGESEGINLDWWLVDVEHDRVFQKSTDDHLVCYSLIMGGELWRKPVGEGAMNLNPRTGSLLVETNMFDHYDPSTGEKDHILHAPEDTRYACAHPSLPYTLYCRFERIPGEGKVWQWQKRYLFEFFNEETGQRAINDSGWKQTPCKAFFHEDHCFVQEIGGVIHKLNVKTGAQQWVTNLKSRGNNMESGGYHAGRQCLVLLVTLYGGILFMDLANGETIKHQLAPKSWGVHTGLHCLVDNNRKLLLMDGRLFDVDTLELLEEGVFASMGLVFGPPEK